jgi:dicarboxylate transporter 10
MMAVCFTHPIDQTKVRSQTQRVRLGMLATARNTVQNFGVLGLWTGLSGSLLRSATYGATRFGVYNELKERDKRRGKQKTRLGLIKNGAIAGMLAGAAGAPAGECLLFLLRCSTGGHAKGEY